MNIIEQHRSVQSIAKAVLLELGSLIQIDDSERTIADKAIQLLRTRGVEETWYYECPAFVLLGSRSCLSISGRDYVPGDELVGKENLVTVDLSPKLGSFVGDCARTYAIENGLFVAHPETLEFRRGFEALAELHRAMIDFVRHETSFQELFRFGNSQIEKLGFINLDFLGNLGHSLSANRDERKFIAEGVAQHLGEYPFFTFEPHIQLKEGTWGFKHENVYCFGEDGRVKEL